MLKEEKLKISFIDNFSTRENKIKSEDSSISIKKNKKKYRDKKKFKNKDQLNNNTLKILEEEKLKGKCNTRFKNLEEDQNLMRKSGKKTISFLNKNT